MNFGRQNIHFIEVPHKLNIDGIWSSNSTPTYILKKKKKKKGTQANFCTQMFISVLFNITKRWKQPKHPSLDQWISKLWYINDTELLTLKWIILYFLNSVFKNYKNKTEGIKKYHYT